MQRRASDEPPRLAASSLDDLLACPRRLADRLHPDHVSAPSSSLGFRASSCLLDIVVAAHDQAVTHGSSLDDALTTRRAADPLPSLSPEERFVVDRGLARYADAFSGTPVALDPRSAALAAPRPSADHRFSLTGAVPIVLAGRVGDEMEARRVVLSQRRMGASSVGSPSLFGADPAVAEAAASTPPHRGPRTNDVALAALLRVERLRVVRVWALGDATPEVSLVGPGDLAALRERLRICVDRALAPDPPPEPGRGCATCPALRHCPGVPQHRLAPFAEVGAP